MLMHEISSSNADATIQESLIRNISSDPTKSASTVHLEVKGSVWERSGVTKEHVAATRRKGATGKTGTVASGNKLALKNEI